MWESRSDFQGTVGRVGNPRRWAFELGLLWAGVSTLSIRPVISTALRICRLFSR